MQVAVCELIFFIPEANSLKAKRQVLQRIVERIKSRCNASIAEIDFQDSWQRASIGIAIIGSSRTMVEKQVNLVHRIVDDIDGAEMTDCNVEYV